MKKKKKLHIKYLSDRRIHRLKSEITAIYATAIPIGIAEKKIVYSGKVENEVHRVESIIYEIIQREYSDLFDTK